MPENLPPRCPASPVRRVATRLTAVFALLAVACAVQAEGVQALRFSIPEGSVLNEFYRQGPVAAHLVVTGGRAPRLVVAFPAGNSGAAVWFDAPSAPLSWRSAVSIEAAHRTFPDARSLRGVTAELSANGGPLTIRQAIVGSVRSIREYQDSGATAIDILTTPELSEREIVWQRRRIDGAAGYYLSIEVLEGAIARTHDSTQTIALAPSPDGRLRVRVTALTGDPPLTPFEEQDLLTATAAPDPRLRNILAFLSYDEKLLAGSWRFNTYFGRDTLMSVRLLSSTLQPRAIEAALASVLERLNPAGEVAHEEDIGEFAVLRRMRAGLPPDDAALFDYKMIDDDFMLAIVAAHYLLDTPAGRARATEFLARRARSGATYGTLLVHNLAFVTASAAAFAHEPAWQHLVALKPGEHVGNWRDSEAGLGGGRYPYDVNGVFVPAALEAIGHFHRSGMLAPYLDAAASSMLSGATAMSAVWQREAGRLFDVRIPSPTARAAAQGYAQQIGIEPSRAIGALGAEPVRFRAVALDAAGRPVPILNSDEGFALLFLHPTPAEAARIADTLMRPFPVGLMTDVGLVVANPAYAPRVLQPEFDRNRYHGSVIWSWQQALLAAGLEHQLARRDLTASARTALRQASARLNEVMQAADAVRGSELWSWSVVNGRYQVASFGQHQADETESNAAQLWSTVQLAR